MSTRVLAAALGYAARGVAVFPATSAVKKSCKSAQFSNGNRWGATRDLREVRHDFTRWNGCRIGLPTGFINRIVVIDVDTLEGHGVDGAASFQTLEAKHGPLLDTRQAISPSGSNHRYFRHPGGGIKIRNSASELGAGIDVRGDGGCIIAPPSVNLDGRAYRWLNRNPLAPMPAWLIELTRDKPRTISERAIAAIRHPLASDNMNRGCGASNAYCAAALEYEIAALASAAPGGRNHALNRASFSLHQLVGGGELDGAEVEHHLVEAAIANGLVDDDGIKAVLATIASGRRAGLQNPRSRR